MNSLNSTDMKDATHPAQWSTSARPARLLYATGDSTFGVFLVASSGRGVRALLLGDRPYTLVAQLHEALPGATLIPATSDDYYQQVVRQIGSPTPPTGIDLPLDLGGGDFEHIARAALSSVPPATRSRRSKSPL